MNNFGTEQEKFWAGEFGDNYIKRNFDSQLIAGNLHLFSRVLTNTRGINSILEFGPNVGLNLIAIKHLLPNAEFNAVEINKNACTELRKLPWVKVSNESILSFKSDRKFDFIFTKGVLIHINPSHLGEVYTKLFEYSNKYIVIAEYYNPTPSEIKYRGHSGKLFKRDFAGEMLNKYSDLRLVDYGFSYHLDSVFPQDDITWFLFEKGE